VDESASTAAKKRDLRSFMVGGKGSAEIRFLMNASPNDYS
jgi:hypothetical protein